MSTQDTTNKVAEQAGKIIEGIKIASVEAAKSAATENGDIASDNANSALETAANLSESPEKKQRDISYQILAEPTKELAGPEATINNFIEFLRVQSGAFIKEGLERLNLVSEVALDPKSVINEEVETQANSTGSNTTDVANTAANTSANGNTLISSATGVQVSAVNTVALNSNNAVHTDAPVVSTNGGDILQNANCCFISTAALGMSNFKSFLHTGDRAVSNLRSSVLVASDITETIGGNNRQVGVNSLQNLGGSILQAADNGGITNLTTGGITTAAKRANTNIAQEVSFYINTESKPLDKIPIAADSESDKNGLGDSEETDSVPTSPTAGSFNIVSETLAGTGLFSIDSIGGKTEAFPVAIKSVTPGVNISLSGFSANVAQYAKIDGAGSKQTFYTPIGTFISSFNIKLGDPEKVEIEGLPAFPRLPKIPTEELEACIPEKFKELSKEESKEESDTGTTTSDTRDGADRRLPDRTSETDTAEEDTTDPNAEEGQTSGEDSLGTAAVEEPNTESATTETKPIDIKPGEDLPANPIPEGIEPYTTGTCATDIYLSKALIDALAEAVRLGAVEGATSGDENGFDLSQIDLSEAVLVDQNELTEVFGRFDVPQERVDQLVNPINNLIKTAYILINEKGEETALKNISEIAELVIDDIAKEVPEADRKVIVDFLNEFPQTREEFYKLIVLCQEAIGFLGSLGGILGGVVAGVGPLLASGIGVDIIGNVLLDYALDLGKQFLIKQLTNFLGDTPFSFLIGVANGLLSGQGFSIQSVLTDVVATGLTKLLPPQYSALIGPLTNIIGQVIEGGNLDLRDIDFRGTVEQIIREATPYGNVVDIVNSVETYTKQIIADYNTGDLSKLLTGSGIRGLLTTILGQNSSGQLNKIFSIVEDTLGIVQAIQALPELLQLMDEYDVPVLDQISTILNCLDLFNKISDLFDNFKNSNSPRAGVARTVQELPRIIQGVNTINELIINPNVNEDEILPPELDRSVINLELNLSRCFKVPQFTLDEATVTIVEQQGLFIFFKASDLLLIQNSLTKRVSINDQLYVKADYFIHPLYGKLVPYVTENQFTQSVFKYNIYEYSLEQNLGVASLIKEVSYLKLLNEDNFIYKFPINAIGTDLTMVISDAYLNK